MNVTMADRFVKVRIVEQNTTVTGSIDGFAYGTVSPCENYMLSVFKDGSAVFMEFFDEAPAVVYAGDTLKLIVEGIQNQQIPDRKKHQRIATFLALLMTSLTS